MAANPKRKETEPAPALAKPPLNVVEGKNGLEGKNAPSTAMELNRLIHERTRLGIISALAANESLSFNELKKILNTTDGNLSVHARKLEDARYIICKKMFEGRMPKTTYRLSKSGRGALEDYLSHMERIIEAARV